MGCNWGCRKIEFWAWKFEFWNCRPEFWYFGLEFWNSEQEFWHSGLSFSVSNCKIGLYFTTEGENTWTVWKTVFYFLGKMFFLPALLPEIWVLRKNLEFWQKIGLSFEILGVLANLSFDENVGKKSLYSVCTNFQKYLCFRVKTTFWLFQRTPSIM